MWFTSVVAFRWGLGGGSVVAGSVVLVGFLGQGIPALCTDLHLIAVACFHIAAEFRLGDMADDAHALDFGYLVGGGRAEAR